MKELFIDNSFNFINKHQHLDEYNKIKIKYGLEVMYYFFTKTFIILLVSYFLNFLKEVLLFNLFYLPLRSTGHGVHAKSNLECWVITIITYSFVILFINYIFLNNLSRIILIVISLLSFIIWSPADTQNLPLIRKSNRLKLKTLSLITLGIEITLLLTTYKQFILISILIETININPITYKILNLKYNNYIDYQ